VGGSAGFPDLCTDRPRGDRHGPLGLSRFRRA
jgi:hypothetical protein